MECRLSVTGDLTTIFACLGLLCLFARRAAPRLDQLLCLVVELLPGLRRGCNFTESVDPSIEMGVCLVYLAQMPAGYGELEAPSTINLVALQ